MLSAPQIFQNMIVTPGGTIWRTCEGPSPKPECRDGPDFWERKREYEIGKRGCVSDWHAYLAKHGLPPDWNGPPTAGDYLAALGLCDSDFDLYEWDCDSD